MPGAVGTPGERDEVRVGLAGFTVGSVPFLLGAVSFALFLDPAVPPPLSKASPG